MTANEKPIAHLGGLFIYSSKPAELKNWYHTHLGIAFEGGGENFYTGFIYQSLEGPKSQVVFSIMKAKQRPDFDDKIYTINLRTNDMKKLVASLIEAGIAVDGPKHYEGQGYFAWIQDPDGNHIELWEDQFNYE